MAIIVALALAGCGLATGYRTANMTPDELTKLFDADLCHFYTGNGPATCSTTVTFKTFYPFQLGVSGLRLAHFLNKAASGTCH